MRLTPFHISLGLSLLVHGVVLGVAYTIRHPAALAGGGSVAEQVETVVIVSEPEASVAAEPQPKPVKSPKPQVATPQPTPDVAKLKPVPETNQSQPMELADDLAFLEELPAPPAPQETSEATPVVPKPTTPVARSMAIVCGVGCRNNPKPAYPLAAQRRREEGLVILALRVTRAGETDDVRVEQGSGHPLLDEAALEAVRQWRFTPARAGSVAIDSQVEVPIRFRLTS